jgi:hypothetical protein
MGLRRNLLMKCAVRRNVAGRDFNFDLIGVANIWFMKEIRK